MNRYDGKGNVYVGISVEEMAIRMKRNAYYYQAGNEIKDTQTSLEHEQCNICLDNKKCILFSCRHVCSCNTCSLKLTDCPLCKKLITDRRIAFI